MFCSWDGAVPLSSPGSHLGHLSSDKLNRRRFGRYECCFMYRDDPWLRAELYDYSAGIFTLWFNLLELGTRGLDVPLCAFQLYVGILFSSVENNFYCLLNNGCFSPRLLQSCNAGPENRPGSPGGAGEDESSSCGRADGKTRSHVDPCGVTLVHLLVH